MPKKRKSTKVMIETVWAIAYRDELMYDTFERKKSYVKATHDLDDGEHIVKVVMLWDMPLKEKK